MAKRLIFACLSLLFLLLPLLTPSVIIAADPFTKTDQSLKDFCNRRKGNQINLETWYSGKCDSTGPDSVGFADIIFMDLYERLAGEQKDSNVQKLKDLIQILKGDVSKGSNLANIQDGLLPQTGRLISFMYSNPPASGVDYLASVQNNLAKHSIVQPVYAQNGFGFTALSPVLPIWKAMRNIAYFFFIIAFVIYGFMIMFRVRIDPKTVATIENSIPKIIGTLLLITFSYAIVGLMIDILYVVTGLVFSAFTATGVIKNDGWNQFLGGLQSGKTLGLLGTTMMIWVQLFAGNLMPRIFTGIINLPIGVVNIIDVILNLLTLGLIIKFIVMVAVLYSLFKLGFSLLKSYIEIILSTIFAPLILLGDILPGNDAFGGWSRGIFANLAAFGASQVLFALSFYFMGGFDFLGLGLTDQATTANTAIWNPPLILTGSSEGVQAIIGLGIILLASKFVDIIKEALKIPPFKYGAAIGEALDYGYGKALQLNEHVPTGTGFWGSMPGGSRAQKILDFTSENMPAQSYRNKPERAKTSTSSP